MIVYEYKREEFFIKVGELYFEGGNESAIQLTESEDGARKFKDDLSMFQRIFKDVSLYAERYNLGKVKALKYVRTSTEEVIELEATETVALESYTKNFKDK